MVKLAYLSRGVWGWFRKRARGRPTPDVNPCSTRVTRRGADSGSTMITNRTRMCDAVRQSAPASCYTLPCLEGAWHRL
jgi:hypothetical protein